VADSHMKDSYGNTTTFFFGKTLKKIFLEVMDIELFWSVLFNNDVSC